MTILTCTMNDCAYIDYSLNPGECMRALVDIKEVGGVGCCTSYKYGGKSRAMPVKEDLPEQTSLYDYDVYGDDAYPDPSPPGCLPVRRTWYHSNADRYPVRRAEPESYPMTRTDAAAEHQIKKHGGG